MTQKSKNDRALNSLEKTSRRVCDCWETGLRTRLTTAFGTQVRTCDIYDALRTRKKRDKETLRAYVQEMELLGSQARVPPEEIRYYVAQGVTENMQIRIALAGAESREQFSSMLEAHEHELRARGPKKGPDTHENSESTNARHNPRCYDCNELGYIPAYCPQRMNKDVECYKCHKKGHPPNACPSAGPHKRSSCS